MTDQKTTLKTKAKTTYEINQLYHDSNKIDHSQWILLSDAEPLELEIQQLKGRINELAIDSGVMCYDCEKCRVPLLEKQIETTKKEKTET